MENKKNLNLVLIGEAPLRDALGKVFNSLDSRLFTESRARHAAVFIVWDDSVVRYEAIIAGALQIKIQNKVCASVANPPETYGVEKLGEVTVYSLLKHYQETHKFYELTDIGKTAKTQEDAIKFCEDWNAKHKLYNAFIDNCRSFADAMTEFMVTHDAAWTAKIDTVSSSQTDIVAPLDDKPFASPLQYVRWVKKHTREGKASVINNRPERKHKYNAVMMEDGRVEIDVGKTDTSGEEDDSDDENTYMTSPVESEQPQSVIDITPVEVPKLRIVILIVGSRGDVQPFIALGQELQKKGHRVRLATHETFRKFVKDGGLEFYPLGGSPEELMAYMVKNPGLLPSFDSIRHGDISKKRQTMKEILESTWRACVDNDDETNLPFVADAIISNPVSYGHIHCAQLLNVPLHIFFTMPWSATRAFPHPLTSISAPRFAEGAANYFSYDAVEMLTWQGLGDIINDFRKEIAEREGVDLDELTSTNGPFLLKDLEVPHTYCFSSSLIPKPKDWGSHIDCSGFIFLNLASSYTPDPELQKFLEAGPPPVYIGFGSIVVDNPDELTKTIFSAVEKAGVRALVSKGWGGLGGKDLQVPSSIHLIGNVPHDWLFQKVAAVCHHGGAGTTSAGLRAGLPTIIVPFFGDQFFWAWELWRAGVSPMPLPFKSKFNVENLAEALKIALTEPLRAKAREVRDMIAKENGAEQAAQSFYNHLPVKRMVCDIDPTKLAAYYSQKYNMKLSASVAAVLSAEGLITMDELKHYRSVAWNTSYANSKSTIGMGITAINKPLSEIGKGVTGLFTEPAYAIKQAATAKNTKEALGTVAGGFGKGVTGVILAPIKASGKLVGGIADVMRTTTAYMENETPEPQRIVTDASSGVTEGLKAFTKSFAAAGVGLVEKPYTGAINEGVVGFVKGGLIGTTSAFLKPVTGTVDLIYLSGKGLAKSAKKGLKMGTHKPQKVLSSTSTVKKNDNNVFVDDDADWKLMVKERFYALVEN
ncbi:hypothetical protein HK098_000067 [Nowakowskiella sp. JEL0407]|nr:hypothetical protein HK098_000058 [Nowakowskiella sp. JEL0407]KAJ3130502.1 hypothetical protein HK098_000067 [Nowakowskiella sp. JEL0407]